MISRRYARRYYQSLFTNFMCQSHRIQFLCFPLFNLFGSESRFMQFVQAAFAANTTYSSTPRYYICERRHWRRWLHFYVYAMIPCRAAWEEMLIIGIYYIGWTIAAVYWRCSCCAERYHQFLLPANSKDIDILCASWWDVRWERHNYHLHHI